MIKPSSLGDIVHAAGVVKRLSESGDAVQVSWIVNAEYAAS